MTKLGIALLLLFGLLLVGSLPLASAASYAIPDTSVELLELEEYSAEIALGENHTFTWGLLNRGGADELILLSATSSNAAFTVEVEPSSVSLARDEFRLVYLNVSAPISGALRETTVELTARGSGSSSSLIRTATVTASAQAKAPGAVPSLLAAGSIIVIGFVASLLFERTKVSELLFLIILGLFLGPVAAGLFDIVLLSSDVIDALTPYITAVALMIILFDGGLNLSFASLKGRFGIALFHTLVILGANILLIGLLAVAVFGYPWPVGILLGAILGGTSGAVVIGLVRRLSASEDVKVITVVEAALTDVLCVVAAFAMIDYLAGGEGASLVGTALSFVNPFLIALVLGGLVGVAMLYGLSRLERKPYGFMLSIGVLLILYGAAEELGGSGSMAAFIFGLVLGNQESFSKKFRRGEGPLSDERFKQFHGELTFLIRTFFFVFLGLVFAFEVSGEWEVESAIPPFSLANNTFWLLLIGTALIFLAIVAIRAIVSAATTYFTMGKSHDRRVLTAMMGRGLAAAVLASVVFSVPAFTSPSDPDYPAYYPLMAPFKEQFLNIAFFIILLTVLATTYGAVKSERASEEERLRAWRRQRTRAAELLWEEGPLTDAEEDEAMEEEALP